MNVLFIATAEILPTKGGIERVTYVLGSQLAGRGYGVAYLAVPRDEGVALSESHLPNQFLVPFGDASLADKLCSLISQRGIDAVVMQGTYPYLLSLLPIIPKGVKRFVVLHNKPYPYCGHGRKIMSLTPWSYAGVKGVVSKIVAAALPALFSKLKLRQGRRIFRSVFANADRFVVLSGHTAERIRQLTPGVDTSKLCVANNPNTFTTVSSIDDGQKENMVLFLARLTNPQKNITGFIDVWKIFSKSNPGWKAMVVGDGEDRAMAEYYAAGKRVENLSFEGSRSNVADYYRRAKIFCMTSTYEGWGMVLTEAMAYGCVPVAYESFEAVRDIIEPSVEGFLAPPFDAEEMAAYMSLLACDETLRRRMAEAGRRKILDFDASRIASRWESLLSE